jgi:hypothetical protein
MSETNMELFLSHSSEDAEFAEALVRLLESAFPAPLHKSIRCTTLAGYGFEVGEHWEKKIFEEIPSCHVHVALVTSRSLDSNYFLMELGARWGAAKDVIRAVAPNVRLSQLPELGNPQDQFDLKGQRQLEALLKRIEVLTEMPKNQPYTYRQPLELVKKITSAYATPAPGPMNFDRTDNPRRLSAERIVEGADQFYRRERAAQASGFVPDIVIGINSGGTLAASIFCELDPNIIMGCIWVIRDQRNTKVDQDRSFVPSHSGEPPRVLLLDSKLGTGSGVTTVVDHLRRRYGENADIRLLVSLLYSGWPGEEEHQAKGRPWPAMLQPVGGSELKMYASYYTGRPKAQDDIEEPGKPPRMRLG